MDNYISRYIITSSLAFIILAFCFHTLAQYPSNTTFWVQLINVEKDTSLSTEKKLQRVLIIKKQFEDSKLPVDSVYARILHRTGLYEYLLNNEVATKNAVTFTLASVRINSAAKKNSSIAFCVNSYTNLAKYYQSLHMYDVSLRYYDSALMFRKKYYVPQISEVSLMLDKAQMLYRTGDYDRAIQEIDIGIAKTKAGGDSLILADLLNQRAQSNMVQGRIEEALKDADEAGVLAKQFDNSTEAINSTLLKADIMAKKKEFDKVVELYQKGINARLSTKNFSQIADDYTDFGNFFLNDLNNYSKAKNCYKKAKTYALNANDFERLSKANINLEQCSFKQQNYKEASFYCIEALRNLKVNYEKILVNPPASQLNLIGNKELLLVILANKTELLLKQFKQTGDTNYLTACLHTALLTDTIITKNRHEQSGEQSKLYWRNWTRGFFTDAMEACYSAGNAELAFYFMEKSRAVLLNDKLNELGAFAHLPQAEAAIEQGYQISILSEQHKLSGFKSIDPGYELQLSKVAQAKADLEHYIRSLEKTYPAYYQYKYADEVATVTQLKKYLSKNKETFVHYFMNDTVVYMICVTPTDVKMIKLIKSDFKSRMVRDFLLLCSDESALNNNYDAFASLSHKLYKLLFQPLNIAKGRVIICPDNFVIPFEALCPDSVGIDFLIKDYVFSYVYSARLLLKNYNAYQAKGDFIGFAPVSFKSYSDVAGLEPSGIALQRSAGYYHNKVLLTNSKASRHNFLNAAFDYTIVNVFSHAFADTTQKEPALYMHDSMITLSDLQLLHNPATKLVVLSACETIVGRNAKGEGILSLARGFASVGVPSVAATLWQANEQTIYEISEQFHKFLSQGISKDEALQKAKLYFLKNCTKTMRLPYYWANIILVGNGEPLKFAEKNNARPWMIFGFTIILLLSVFYYLRKKRIV